MDSSVLRGFARARVRVPAFFRSIRARLLLIALLLLLIPLIGYRFLQEMDRYLREGQQQVLTSAARLPSAIARNNGRTVTP